MKIAPVDYMPVMQTPPANDKKDQTDSLYLDRQESNRETEDADRAECPSTTQFRISSLIPAHEYFPYNHGNHTKYLVAESYDGNNLGWGNNAFVGWAVDTVT